MDSSEGNEGFLPQSKEARLRAEAKRFARLEKKISKLMGENLDSNHNNQHLLLKRTEKGNLYLALSDTSVQGEKGAGMNSMVDYLDNSQGASGSDFGCADELGITSPGILSIWGHGDRDTMEEFREYASNMPWTAGFATQYYISEEGEFKKVSTVDIASDFKMPDTRKPLKTVMRTAMYESPVGTGDYEIVGQALNSIIRALESPTS